MYPHILSIQPAFTRFFGASAIYAINPVDEATARHTANSLNMRPIESWDVREMIKKNVELQLPALSEKVVQDAEFDNDEDQDDDTGF